MPKDLQVLVIEDSEDDTKMLVKELQNAGFTPTCRQVETVPALKSALAQRNWDVVVCDHSMPGMRSQDALHLLRREQGDVPFIVVSGTMGEDNAVNIVKAGANDYVMKSNRTRLVPAIERELREAEERRARREAEAALKRNQQELEDFFDRSPLGLHWEGPDGVILRANETELAMLGYSRDEYIGHRMAEFHADDGCAEEILARLRIGESLSNFEARLRCKNGAIKEVVLDANVLLEEGRFVHARCFTRDVTGRNRARRELDYLAAIVEDSDDAIIGTDLDGTVLSWNAGARRMYGFDDAQMKGRPIYLISPSKKPDEFADIYEQVKRGEWICRYESKRLCQDGRILDVAVTMSPIKNSDGLVVGVSAIERDITNHKRETNERLKLIEELTEALRNIKTLRGLLPICASCKKIRDDGGYWQRVESYISQHTNAEFTHGLCPDCLDKLYPDPKK